jgi:hypothetical protein
VSLVIDTSKVDRVVLQGGIFRQCPKCGKRKDICEFGLRRVLRADGTVDIRNQSWCTVCRSSKGGE